MAKLIDLEKSYIHITFIPIVLQLSLNAMRNDSSIGRVKEMHTVCTRARVYNIDAVATVAIHGFSEHIVIVLAAWGEI